MLISFAGPLDLTWTLESGQTFRWRREEPDGASTDAPWYHGVVFDNIVRVRRVSDGVEFTSHPDDESALEPLVRSYLRLDDDLEAVYCAIDVDERIGSAIRSYHGMRLARQDPWECLISFICSSTSNIPRISGNVEDMSTHFGHRLVFGDIDRGTFPGPEALSAAGEDALRRLGLGFRAKYVAAVAETVAAGGLDLFALREAPYDEALEALTGLPGVGDKVANCVLLFSLDKLDAFPVDVWIHRALADWYLDPDRKLNRVAMRRWAQQHFGPYAGYANQYLFHDRRLMGRAPAGNGFPPPRE